MSATNLDYDLLLGYIAKIRKEADIDFYANTNTTLICNPYTTQFPQFFFSVGSSRPSKLRLFLLSCIKFYARSLIYLLSFLYGFLVHKHYFKKPIDSIELSDIVLDLFVDVDKVGVERAFNDTYFATLYPVLDEEKKGCVFLPRLRNVSLNPLKSYRQLRSFYHVINKDYRNFIFEYDLLSITDFFRLFWMVACYPFKTLSLIQKEASKIDTLFNSHLMKDIPKVGLDVFSRYIFGKNLQRIKNLTHVYSWSEFQDIERSFNFAIRENDNIEVTACQFLIGSPNYLHLPVREIDVFTRCAPHKVLVNGQQALRVCSGVEYDVGVSLRYGNVFKVLPKAKETSILVLGSYDVLATKNTLNQLVFLDKYLFKGHPAISDSTFKKELGKAGIITNESIYELFSKSEIIIASAGGAAAEAVACGLSVIIIGSGEELMNNTLAEYGKGQIWDFSVNETDLKDVYKNLLKYRSEHPKKIKVISSWYRNNYFIEPTKLNISKIFS